MNDKNVTLAAIAGAHGIAGEVRLKLFAANADSLKRHSQLQVGDRALTLKSVRPGAMPIARFAEISTRDEAEALRSELVTVPRDALPPLEEGEYYHADMLGLPVVDAADSLLGEVIAVENFGAGDLLDIRKPDGRTALIPFRPGVADMADGRVIADPAFLA